MVALKHFWFIFNTQIVFYSNTKHATPLNPLQITLGIITTLITRNIHKKHIRIDFDVSPNGIRR